MYHSLKNININKIDFQKLISLLVGDGLFITCFYYNASLDRGKDEQRYWEQQKFFDMLRKIPGFTIILCRMRKHGTDKNQHFDVKGDDVHLAVDLVSGAYENLYDVAIIVSGDEDFVPAIQKAQKLGKKIVAAYFWSSISSYLRQVCDDSICLDRITEQVRLD